MSHWKTQRDVSPFSITMWSGFVFQVRAGGIGLALGMVLLAILVGGGFFALGWHFYASNNQLRDDGIALQVPVSGKRSKTERKTAETGDLRTDTYYYLRVEYLPTGETTSRSAEISVTGSEYAAVATNSRVMIRYLPSDPTRLETEVSLQSAASRWAIPGLFFLFGCAALLLFGVGAWVFSSDSSSKKDLPRDQSAAE